jgi:branched-chain amino acid transport system substrate-binding protein
MKPMILAGMLFGSYLAGAVFAQSTGPIKLADVAELSGGGATVAKSETGDDR